MSHLDFAIWISLSLVRLHYYSLRIHIRQRTRHDSLPLSICSPGAGRPLPFAYRCEFRSPLLFSPDTQHILLSLLCRRHPCKVIITDCTTVYEGRGNGHHHSDYFTPTYNTASNSFFSFFFLNFAYLISPCISSTFSLKVISLNSS